jgi:hypothetical protein
MSAILLNAIASCETEGQLEQVYELVKETKVTEKAVANAIKEAQRKGIKVGGKVMFYGDKTDIGKVLRFNTSTVGFYTGDRYPVVVEFKRGTFEYEIDGLTPLE